MKEYKIEMIVIETPAGATVYDMALAACHACMEHGGEIRFNHNDKWHSVNRLDLLQCVKQLTSTNTEQP